MADNKHDMAMLNIDGMKLRRTMALKLLTVKDIKEQAGIGEATIRRALAGGKMRAGTLAKLCRALECEPIDIAAEE